MPDVTKGQTCYLLEAMGAIAIVGLGPGGLAQVTEEVRALLQAALAEGRTVLRTRVHPTVEAWPALAAAPSLDAHYAVGEHFDQVYASIAADVLDRAAALPEGAELVYAVPGHPSIGEATSSRIRALAPERGTAVRLVPGLSFVDAVTASLGVDAGEGLCIKDALALGRLEPTTPLLVCQVYSRRVASHVKLALGKHYPDEHEVVLVKAAGVAGQEQLEPRRLFEIDRDDFADHLTSLWVPALAPLAALREPDTLREIMVRLRAPEGGCPWDREQTHQTLRRYLLEETYEALDALDAGDLGALEEELGDLFLQIVFHAQVADESATFDLGDVVAGISAKLIRRHPHVFGDVGAQDSATVLRNWETLKRQEREGKAEAEKSMLDGVPRSMPALAGARAIQERAARVGFDWPDVAGVVEKVAEEAQELAEATDETARQAELGDLLFTLVNLARRLSLDPEDALRESSQRFRVRFAHMEGAARRAGRPLEAHSPAQLDALWEAAKVVASG